MTDASPTPATRPENEELFRAAFDDAPNGIALVDLEGRFQRVNDAYCRTVGYPREYLLETDLQSITHPDNREETAGLFERLIAGEISSYQLDKRYIAGDGRDLHIQVNASLSRDAQGRARHVIGQIQDLTERDELMARAVRSARRYEREHRVVEALQQSLLPQIPEIPGVDVAIRYRPAGKDGTEVGGDFYDAFQTSDDVWSFVIGDVAGKGVQGATLTSLVRHTIRAAAMHERDARRILAMLGAAIARERSDESFCTVAYTRLELTPAVARLSVACGGHPLPLLLRADGALEYIGTPGMLLGPFEDPDVTEETVEVRPGDTLVLYTDGVVESRTPDGFLGQEGLAALLQGYAGEEPATIANRIERAAVESVGGLRDDVALMVVRLRGEREQASATSLSMRLAGGPSAPLAARRALDRFEQHLVPEQLWNARLLLSEIVTNSVLHGRVDRDDWIELEASVRPDVLRVLVADTGPGFTPTSHEPSDDQTGGRGLFLVEQIADRWGVEDGGRRVWFELGA